VLWLPWALLLSAGGAWLGIRAYRRGDRTGAVAWAGWALVPPALLLTGTLRLVGRVVGATLDWAAGLVFTPTTWLGVVLGGAAALLLGTARALRGRRSPDRAARPRGEPAREALPARADQPPPRRGGRAGGSSVDDDLAEVEEILRRRGIG